MARRKSAGLSDLEKVLSTMLEGQKDMSSRLLKLEKQVDKIQIRVPVKRGRPPSKKKVAVKKKGKPGRKKTKTTCSVRGCSEPYYAKGLCVNHYQKSRRDTTKKVAPKKSTRRMKKPGRKKKAARKN